jgi:hypothetical protein
MKNNLIKTRQGSSLIVTLLLMAILLVMTLGLSMLTITELRQTGDVVGAGKAYYAAEAGIENALLDLNSHLPGFQTANVAGADEEGWVGMEDGDFSYRYRVRNQGDAYPYFDDDTPVFLPAYGGMPKQVLYTQHPEETYSILTLNQTVTIPLFIDCGDGVNYKDVKKWLLQYYVDFDTDPDNTLQLGTRIQDFDILRWKLFGEPIVPDPLAPSRTHAISDFYPASENDGPTRPVCIGSDIDLALGEYNDMKNQTCTIPVAKYVNITSEDIADWQTNQVEPDPVLENSWGQARECYTRDAGAGVAPSASGVQQGCNISSFMSYHRKNYLTITNVVNPDIIGITDPVLRAAKANIHYRIIAEPDATESCPDDMGSDEDIMARDYAQISADGYANDGLYRQSIDAKLKLNSFLPVFNFTLFRTDPDAVNPEDKIIAPLPFFKVATPLKLKAS